MSPQSVEPRPDELVVVVGPTATGKSALAMHLAERLDGEIIGADSVQIYRAFDIGTGKPDATAMEQVRHHLVDCVDPLQTFDAARFVELADRAIADVRARNRVPIVCGGTFLWVKALLFGLAKMPAGDADVRARHEAEAQAAGRPALHARLAAIDPTAAERLAPNDLVRVSRALEVFELTGKTLTAWHAEHRFGDSRHRAQLVGVFRDRDDLDARIRTRTQQWLDEGWVAHVETLRRQGYGEARAMDAVGFRQVCEHLDGKITAAELPEAIIRATRKFVRRQRTWLRDQDVRWLSAREFDRNESAE